ncbi:MAG: N-6 DNA methylase, partial [Deltaproteobacteria bacterium]|nr:N-6 DNA methylase [Deltaproteobacteria bacterium]
MSNIYEEFLESKKGIVYTPPYLVNFLIDEQMPLTDFHKTDFKVIDPACGSGVFLVAAFRRMI